MVNLAGDGHSGLLLALAQLPEKIVMEFILANMDGFDVCIELKNNIKTREIPVIFIQLCRM